MCSHQFERAPVDQVFLFFADDGLSQTVVAIALPTIVQDLHGGGFVWVGTAYALAATALLPVSGAFAEVCFCSDFFNGRDMRDVQLFGRRLAMLSSLGFFALGSALCGAAQNMSWLIAARGECSAHSFVLRAH